MTLRDLTWHSMTGCDCDTARHDATPYNWNNTTQQMMHITDKCCTAFNSIINLTIIHHITPHHIAAHRITSHNITLYHIPPYHITANQSCPRVWWTRRWTRSLMDLMDHQMVGLMVWWWSRSDGPEGRVGSGHDFAGFWQVGSALRDFSFSLIISRFLNRNDSSNTTFG